MSYLSQQSGIDAKVFMPDTAPDDRKEMMEGLGATVTKVPGEGLLDAGKVPKLGAGRRVLVEETLRCVVPPHLPRGAGRRLLCRRKHRRL